MDDDYTIDQGREATAVQDAFIDGAESLLNELSVAFDDPTPPKPPQAPAESLLNELSGAFDDPSPPKPPEPSVEVAAVPPEETPVSSPPRIDPPAMIWKPSRRARFKLRLR